MESFSCQYDFCKQGTSELWKSTANKLLFKGVCAVHWDKLRDVYLSWSNSELYLSVKSCLKHPNLMPTRQKDNFFRVRPAYYAVVGL